MEKQFSEIINCWNKSRKTEKEIVLKWKHTVIDCEVHVNIWISWDYLWCSIDFTCLSISLNIVFRVLESFFFFSLARSCPVIRWEESDYLWSLKMLLECSEFLILLAKHCCRWVFFIRTFYQCRCRRSGMENRMFAIICYTFTFH